MKRVLKIKQKAFLIVFKKLSDAKNCLNPESSSLAHFQDETNCILIQNCSMEIKPPHVSHTIFQDVSPKKFLSLLHFPFPPSFLVCWKNLDKLFD